MWLACSRAYISELEARKILGRVGGKFPLRANVNSYVQYLRRERNRDQSSRSQAAAELAAVKAKWLRLRLAEKERSLMPTHRHESTFDAAVGIVLTVLSDLPARLYPTASELQARRLAESIILDARREIADKCLKHAEAFEAAGRIAVQQTDAVSAENWHELPPLHSTSGCRKTNTLLGRRGCREWPLATRAQIPADL
jgi:hypothetical protein